MLDDTTPKRGGPKRVPIEERFWPKVRKGGPEECWEWLASKYPGGYGAFGVRGTGSRPAHRVAWMLVNGDIDNGLEVCHRCDTPACVNPAHLFLGTHQDNMTDMVTKGRSRSGMYGEAHTSAKLTEQGVVDIRRRYAAGGVSQQFLADEYGVSQAVISHVVLRRTWKTVR